MCCAQSIQEAICGASCVIETLYCNVAKRPCKLLAKFFFFFPVYSTKFLTVLVLPIAFIALHQNF